MAIRRKKTQWKIDEQTCICQCWTLNLITIRRLFSTSNYFQIVKQPRSRLLHIFILIYTAWKTITILKTLENYWTFTSTSSASSIPFSIWIPSPLSSSFLSFFSAFNLVTKKTYRRWLKELPFFGSGKHFCELFGLRKIQLWWVRNYREKPK